MKEDARVEIHGNVGQVFAGPVTQHKYFLTSGYPPEEVQGTAWWELPTDQLEEHLRAERTQFWRAWRRYWFNGPSFLIAAMLLATTMTLAAAVVTKGPTGLVGAVEWWLPISLVCGLIPTGIWLHRIRRTEGIVAAQAQENIDSLEAVLTRRKRQRR